MVAQINQNEMDGPSSLQYYMDIINSMPGIVYWMDKDCILMGCNHNFVKLLHLENMKDMRGTPYDLMIKHLSWPKEYIKSLKNNDITVLFSKKPTYEVEESPIKNKEGVATYYRTTRVPLFDKNRNVIGLVVILTDITELKLIEAQLNIKHEEKKIKEPIQKLKHPIRLLLVEDDNVTLNVEKNMFTKLGCKVDVAVSESEAEKLFSLGKYDIIFLDIRLGEDSGYVVAKKIRTIEENTKNRVPIIALTTSNPDTVRSDCEYYSMNDVFQKPLSPEQALQIFKRYIDEEE